MNSKYNFKTTKEEPLESVNEIAEEVIEEKMGKVINCNLLNIREYPNSNSKVIGLISKGEEIKIIDGANDKFYKTPIGFVMKDYIELQ